MKRLVLAFGFLLSIFCLLAWAQAREEDKGVKIGKKTPNFQEYAIPFENQWAFIIGVNTYPYYKNLRYATPEAEKVKDLLIKRYGYLPEKVKYLHDQGATDDNISDQLISYILHLKEKDSLFIYFSGHGLEDDVLNVAYWLPCDVGKDKEHLKSRRERLNESKLKVSSHKIKDTLRACKAKHIFVVADSCYSAQLFRVSKGTETKGFSRKAYEKKSRQLLASGRALVGDGVFGSYFIRYIKENKETALAASDLISDVKRGVKGKSDLDPEGWSVDGTGDEYGEFYFFLKNSVLVEEIAGDFKKIQEIVRSKTGTLGERLAHCNRFLTRHNGAWDSVPPAAAKATKETYSKVEKFKNDLLYEQGLNDADINNYLTRGDRAFSKGKYVRALEFYEKILEKRPNDTFALAKKKKCGDAAYDRKAALSLYSEKKYDKAFTYLEKLVEISPFDTEVNKKVVEIKKRRWRDFVQSANQSFDSKNYEDAAGHYEKALNLFPRDGEEFKKIAYRGIDNLIAAARIKKCREELDFDVSINNMKLKTYLEFIKKYPASSHIAALKKKLISVEKNLPPGKYWANIRRNKKGYWEHHFEDNHIMIWVPKLLFWVDKYEVSNRQWESFAGRTGRKIGKAALGNMPKYIRNYSEYPAVVTLNDARGYCRANGVKLLSAEEWMIAAVKDIGFKYPWGNTEPHEDGKFRANGESLEDGHEYTAPVASFEQYASPYGLVNMAGNVAEWVSGGFLKGGGFLSKSDALQIASEENANEGDTGGFRCLRYESESRIRKGSRKNRHD